MGETGEESTRPGDTKLQKPPLTSLSKGDLRAVLHKLSPYESFKTLEEALHSLQVLCSKKKNDEKLAYVVNDERSFFEIWYSHDSFTFHRHQNIQSILNQKHKMTLKDLLSCFFLCCKN